MKDEKMQQNNNNNFNVFILIASATALKECKEVMKLSDIPCEIITSWDYPNICETYEIKVYNQTPLLVYNNSLTNYTGTGRCNQTFNITDKGSYIVNISNGGDSARIIIEGEDNMGSLSITIFILLITVTLFYLSTKEYNKSKFANIIIKRSFMVLGIYLMMLNSAIMASIAEASGLGITQEMFFFVRIFGIIGYPAMLFLMLGGLINALKVKKEEKNNERYGVFDDE